MWPLAAASLVAGGIGAAGQAGAFGGAKQNGYSKGDMDALAAARSREINSFESSLASMRAQYLAQIPGLNKAAFNQFGNDAAANFGAHGMDAGSGAFQSALGRAAIPMQAHMYDTAYTSGVNNANSVNAARGALSGVQMGAASAGLSAPTQNPMWAGLGQFAGQAGTMALYKAGNPAPETANSPAIRPQYTPGQGMPLWRD